MSGSVVRSVILVLFLSLFPSVCVSVLSVFTPGP